MARWLVVCLFPLVLALDPALSFSAEPEVYELRADQGVYKAANPAQGFDAWIGPDQVEVRPHKGDWELDLTLVRTGRDGALSTVEAAKVALNSGALYISLSLSTFLARAVRDFLAIAGR